MSNKFLFQMIENAEKEEKQEKCTYMNKSEKMSPNKNTEKVLSPLGHRCGQGWVRTHCSNSLLFVLCPLQL